MLNVKYLRSGAKVPSVANEGDLGYDLYACEDTRIFNDCVTGVCTGISVQDTEGYGFIVKDRSSMAMKGIFTHAGVIDAGYTGEIKIMMTCLSHEYMIRKYDKIAQMIPVKPLTSKVYVVEDHVNTERGDKGFGSSGK